jgi:hypothetical protein
MTKIREVPDFRELKRGTYYHPEINLSFLILSCLIFQSNVERGIPSFAAAPFGPATFLCFPRELFQSFLSPDSGEYLAKDLLIPAVAAARPPARPWPPLLLDCD